jgi:hypothetical protein
MRNHLTGAARRKEPRQSDGVRELKTHSSDETPDALDAVDAAAAWEAFLRTGRRLERRFTPGANGVRLVSAMRR